MTVVEFLVANFRDAERRLSRLTELVTDDQNAMWRIVDDSVIGRILAWITQQFDRAQPSSQAIAAWHRTVSSWGAYEPALRMRLTGIVVLTASGVHVALAASAQPVGGWWLILPGLAATFGALAMLLSWLGPTS